MEKKQTAVNWLWEELDNTIPYQNIKVSQIFNGLLEQALQTEKEQMIDLIKFIRNQDKMGKSANDLYEEYYNEKYEE
jgi:hypothetical protein